MKVIACPATAKYFFESVTGMFKLCFPPELGRAGRREGGKEEREGWR